MRKLKMAALALAAVIGSGLAVNGASAMPVDGLAPAAKEVAGGVQDVRWVCGPYRCWWRPAPYWAGGPYRGAPYWGPHPYGWRYGYWHRRYW